MFNINNQSVCNLLISNGIANFESDIAVVGFEINVIGKATIESLLPDNWYLAYSRTKIIIVDLSGQGITNGNIFKVNGKIKIKNATIVDINTKTISKINFNDDNLFKWDKSSQSDYNINTITWDSLKSQNIKTQYKTKTSEESAADTVGSDATSMPASSAAPTVYGGGD